MLVLDPVYGICMLFLVCMVIFMFVRARMLRRRCVECGSQFVPNQYHQLQTVCPQCRQKRLSTHELQQERLKPFRTLGWSMIAALVMLVLASWLSGPSIAWDTMLIPMAAIIAVPVILIGVLLARGFFRLHWHNSETNDFGQARRISGMAGEVVAIDPIRAWIGDRVLEPDAIHAELEATRAPIMELFGPDAAVTAPLRMICFARKCDFVAYFKRFGITPGSMEAFYLYKPIRKIVCCGRSEPGRFVDARRSLRITFGYYRFDVLKGFFGPSWLSTGVGYFVSAVDPIEVYSAHRQCLVARERGVALSADDFFDLSNRRTLKAMREVYEPEQFRLLTQRRAQAWSLAAYLAEPERREQLRKLAREWRKTDRLDEALPRLIGRTPAQLLADWNDWLRLWGESGERERYLLPPAHLRDLLLQEIIPFVRDRRQSLQDRITAVRDMGQQGYLLGCDTLIEQLGEGDDLRREAAWALEAISGRTLGDDSRRWRQWWDELPAVAQPV
jgi:hypothetical protein